MMLSFPIPCGSFMLLGSSVFEVLCKLFRVSGYLMVDKLVVPRRKVKKNWYVGLDSDLVDRSQPDICS